MPTLSCLWCNNSNRYLGSWTLGQMSHLWHNQETHSFSVLSFTLDITVLQNKWASQAHCEDASSGLTEACVRLLPGPLTLSPGQRRPSWRRDRAASLNRELLYMLYGYAICDAKMPVSCMVSVDCCVVVSLYKITWHFYVFPVAVDSRIFEDCDC